MRWSLRELIQSYGMALGSVALVTVLVDIIDLRVRVANESMLYLLAVLATAVVAGRGPAILASLASFLTFNFLFIEPRYTFQVADPNEWLALLLLLATALVTGQLAAVQRERAREAEAREHEAVLLLDIVRLLNERDLPEALDRVADKLLSELELESVEVELHSGAEMVRAAAEAGNWQAASPTADWRRTVVVAVEAHGEQLGELRVVRRADSLRFDTSRHRLLLAVATQLGIAVERTRLRKEATEAEILRRTDELRTALLNAVSHNLRTPLASILASAGSLLQEDMEWTDAERREFAQAIEQEARRLDRIVGNVLDLSRLDAGALRPAMDWYDLGALVDDVLSRLRAVIDNHLVVVEVPSDLPPVRLDYVEIDQVLSNLLENAARYSQPGSEIRVSAMCSEREDGQEITVTVLDRGPGIPEELLPRIFEPFFRGDSVSPSRRGTGLGLAVSKRLVEAHGGRMTVTNRPQGGARFTFTLPLGTADLEALPEVVT